MSIFKRIAKVFKREYKTDIKEVFSGDEIILKDLFLLFWERKFVFWVTCPLMLIVAIVQITTTPKSYDASSTYISQSSGGAVSQSNSGLLDLLGVSSGNQAAQGSGSFTDPNFFPSIVASQAFLLDLMKEEFYFGSYGKELSLEEFVLQYDSRNVVSKVLGPVMSVPGKFLSLFEKKAEPIDMSIPNNNSIDEAEQDSVLVKKNVSPLLFLTMSEITAMSLLQNRIGVSSGGVMFTISTNMPDPIVCAKLNQMVANKLMEFAVENETIKERTDLSYVERRVATAKLNFEQSQEALAVFRDKNQGVVSARSLTIQQRLEAEHNIRFGIYQRLATSLEEKKIALEERTPVFKVFEPVFVPLEPSGGISIKKVLTFVVLGVVLGFGCILLMVARGLFRNK